MKYERKKPLQKISNELKSSIITMRINKYGIGSEIHGHCIDFTKSTTGEYQTHKNRLFRLTICHQIRVAFISLLKCHGCHKIARGNVETNGCECRVTGRDTSTGDLRSIDLLASECCRAKYHMSMIEISSQGVIAVRLMKRCHFYLKRQDE